MRPLPLLKSGLLLLVAVGLVPESSLAGAGNQRRIAFPQASCTGCHGLPPVSQADIPLILPGKSLCSDLVSSTATNARCENYVGGGAAHWKHVSFIKDPSRAGVDASLEQQCSPCHGLRPGGACWHLEAKVLTPTYDFSGAGFYAWPVTFQQKVDIADGYTNLRSGTTGGTGRYTGGAAAAVQTILSNPDPGSASCPQKTGGAKGGTPQQCASFNCHGAAAPYNATPVIASPYDAATLNYYVGGSVPTSYPYRMRLTWGLRPGTSDPWARDVLCAGCHGAAPAMAVPGTPVGGHPADPATLITVRNAANNGDVYTSAMRSQGAAANYFGTVSGYARGGHGDRNIQPKSVSVPQGEDPGVDSATTPPAPSGQAVTPLHCSACHDDTAAHFPPAGTGTALTRYRLSSSPSTMEALCNKCHAVAQYPGAQSSGATLNHHPADYYYKGTTKIDVIPKTGTTVLSTYSANGKPLDFFVNFWSGSDLDGNPVAVLPLEQYVPGGASTNRILCVTCHNPHGSDLFSDVTSAKGSDYRSIPDNNMLRLRDENNVLCKACHPS